jgi:hypothetical protein
MFIHHPKMPFNILGDVAEFRKGTISFVIPVGPAVRQSVRMEQLDGFE